MIPKVPLRRVQLFKAVEELHPRRILETGVCPGAMTLGLIRFAQTFVTDPKEISYYGFDLFMNPPAYELDPTARGVSKDTITSILAPTRASITLIAGDSRRTLPQFVAMKPPFMDVIHIDGGHSVKTIKSDWESCRKLMHEKTVLIFDDYWGRADGGARVTVDAIDRGEYSVEFFDGGSFPRDERLAPSYFMKVAVVRKRV